MVCRMIRRVIRRVIRRIIRSMTHRMIHERNGSNGSSLLLKFLNEFSSLPSKRWLAMFEHLQTASTREKLAMVEAPKVDTPLSSILA